MSTETQIVTPDQQENRFLKLADPKQGEKTSVKVRLLDYPGVLVFRHWIGEGPSKRPYNCPSKKGGCPACRERAIVKARGEDHRAVHRMDRRFYVNALELSDNEDPKLKIFAYGPALGKRIQATIDRGAKFADPTSYDATVTKRKTGPNTFDVEYDFWPEESRELTKVEKALVSNKHDLKLETADATPEQIGAAMKGEKPTSNLATPEQRKEVEKVLKNQSLTYLDLRIADPDQLTSAKAEEIIKDLG